MTDDNKRDEHWAALRRQWRELADHLTTMYASHGDITPRMAFDLCVACPVEEDSWRANELDDDFVALQEVPYTWPGNAKPWWVKRFVQCFDDIRQRVLAGDVNSLPAGVARCPADLIAMKNLWSKVGADHDDFWEWVAQEDGGDPHDLMPRQETGFDQLVDRAKNPDYRAEDDVNLAFSMIWTRGKAFNEDTMPVEDWFKPFSGSEQFKVRAPSAGLP